MQKCNSSIWNLGVLRRISMCTFWNACTRQFWKHHLLHPWILVSFHRFYLMNYQIVIFSIDNESVNFVLIDERKHRSFSRSVDLETKLSSPNLSKKMNGRICFSILTTRKYLKLEFGFQVFLSRQDKKINSLACFLGEVAARQFYFEIYWPFRQNNCPWVCISSVSHNWDLKQI